MLLLNKSRRRVKLIAVLALTTLSCTTIDVTREILRGLFGRPHPATWYVAAGGDDDVPCYLPAAPCATVPGAHRWADDGDTIHIAAGTYSMPTSVITKSITIEGEGASATILDGGREDRRLVQIGSGLDPASPEVIVRDLTLQNSSGGAILILAGSELNMRDATVRRNSDDNSSGGIWNEGAFVGEDLLVESNDYVGDLWTCGGIENDGTFQLINSTVISNSGVRAGGICNYDSGEMLLWNVEVVENTGGGIYNHGLLTVESSTIGGNRSGPHDSDGWGLYNSGLLTISAGTMIEENLSGGLRNSTLGEMTLDEVTIQGNNGVGILNYNDATLSNTSVVDNRPIGTSDPGGGGIINGFFDEEANLTLTDVVIADNQDPEGLKSGLFNGSGTVRMERVTVRGNRGPGVNNQRGSMLIMDSEITNQINGEGLFSVAEAEVRNTRITDNGGGGIVNREGGDLLLVDSTIADNRDGRISALLNFGTAFISNSTISGNHATDMSSALTAAIVNSPELGGVGRIDIENSTISGNFGQAQGGGIQNRGTLSIASSSIVANIPFGLQLIDAGTVRLEGALFAQNGTSCSGTSISSRGYNLDDDGSCLLTASTDLPAQGAPRVLALAANGGPTRTHALASDSPAVDAAGGACLPTDQRGDTRPSDGDGDGSAACDIGAFELDPSGAAGSTSPESSETPVPTPTSVAESEPFRPISINFNADSYALVAGECTRLRWEVLNADDVLLEGEPVEPLEAEEICPQQTRTYWIVASNSSEEAERSVTIEVTEAVVSPEAPSQLHISNQICSDQAYSVSLSWTDQADNEDGYYVYRDGSKIATLGENANSYTDDPPYGGPYTYGVEAFNSARTSSRSTVEESGCIH